MGGHLAPVVKPDVGQKPLVAPDQPGGEKRSGKAHFRPLYRPGKIRRSD
jgi:hypothetical protein